MRSVLLPALDQPAIIGTWMKFYERWQNEVDHLYVDINHDSHAAGMKRLVEGSKGDFLLFVESDGIIFTQGIVDKMFRLLESGEADVIWSERMSCTPEFARIAKEQFSLDYSGLGDHGPGAWPNFFFVRRDLLLQTDLHFGPKNWKPGETLLGVSVKEECTTDVMGWIALQLRAMTKKIVTVPQYHTDPNDLEHYKNHTGIFDHHAPWMHIGSLSGDMFTPHSEMERKELTKRLVWRFLCGEDVDTSLIDMKEFLYWGSAWKELLKI